MSDIVLEGTWEEIARHAEELAGRRLRVTVLKEAPTAPADPNHSFFTSSPEERERTLDEHACRFKDLPGLPHEAFDRETLYDDSL